MTSPSARPVPALSMAPMTIAPRSSPVSISGISGITLKVSRFDASIRSAQRAQSRQHMLAVQAQETILIPPGSMEDEMAKPEIHVCLDFCNVLIGIGRYDP